MSKKLTAIRGMNDILPVETASWQFLEERVRQLLARYGYGEIRLPILEYTDLFCRSIGEVTDIVEKEMYTFADRNGESLTLRPEGTASCVRAAEQHGLLYNQTQKLWYMGPMFRYERPQKGRYRQFHQIGVETFGFAGPDIDAELIMLTARLWRELGIQDQVSLQLNSLGSNADRARYKADLVAFLQQHHDSLDEDSQRRLDSNPLRILDTKNEQTRQLLAEAPVLLDYLSEDAKQHFEQLQQLLDAVGIGYEINPKLVRGLDYYCNTVFEWVTGALGAQGTVCAGGRYDGLVAQLGGKPTPAVGFAMGLERLVLLMATLQIQPGDASPDCYLLAMSTEAEPKLLPLAEFLRDQCPALKVQTHCGGGKFKKQIKKADDSGAEYALILGAEELAADTVSIKPLRQQAEQVQIPRSQLGDYFNDLFKQV